jgi:hypothetical protein
MMYRRAGKISQSQMAVNNARHRLREIELLEEQKLLAR